MDKDFDPFEGMEYIDEITKDSPKDYDNDALTSTINDTKKEEVFKNLEYFKPEESKTYDENEDTRDLLKELENLGIASGKPMFDNDEKTELNNEIEKPKQKKKMFEDEFYASFIICAVISSFILFMVNTLIH